MQQRLSIGKAWSAAFTTSVALLGFAGTAAAQQECGDTTCDVGFECASYEIGCPEIAIACEEGTDCPATTSDCQPSTQQYCERAKCTTDAECGDFMVCHTYDYPCDKPVAEPAPACDGPDCTAPADVVIEECQPSSESICTPRWELPCTADADCGDGFTCKQQESCGCSGSAGTASSGSTGAATPASTGDSGGSVDPDAVTDPPAPPPTDPVAPETRPADMTTGDLPDGCFCELSEEMYCEVNETECTADSDCPTDWTCVEYSDGGCAVSSDGTSTCDDVVSKSTCQPPYDRVYPQGGVGIAELSSADGGDIAATSGPAVGGSALPPTAAPGPAAQSTATDSNSVSDGAGEESGMSASSGKGCSVAGPTLPGSNGLLWSGLGLAMLLGWRRRRSDA